MPRRQPKKSHGLVTLLVVGLIVILAATIGGLYAFGPGSSRGSVTVAIEGPTTVTSGDEVTYVIAVQNADAALGVADLTMEYPVGFLVTSVYPAASNSAGQSLFNLAPLAAGGEARVTVTGRLLGSVGTAAEVRARLDYEPENFRSSFHVDASAITTIAASRVRLTFDAPSTAVSPGQLEMSIAVESVADVAMNGVEVVLELPEGVSATSSTPPLASVAGELRYDLGTIQPAATWRAVVNADIVGDGGARRGVAVAVYQRIGGQRVIVERALREVEVVQPSAAVELVVGNSTSSSQVFTGGTSVPLTVSFRNTGTTALGQLVLRLRLNGAAVEWDRFTELAGGRRDGDAVTWDSQSTGIGGSLGQLEPGAQGSVSLSLPTAGFVGMQPSTIQLVAILTSVAYGEDWQAAAGPVPIVIQ